MADTGSEIAEGTTRSATGVMGRILERELMMRMTSPRDTSTPEPQEIPSDIEIGVRCPEDDLDARAEEILEALERGHVDAACAIDDERSTIVLAVHPSQGDATLRALERLSASKRSGFAIDDVIGVENLEAVVGRRALGRDVEARAKDADVQGTVESVESVALTFARHPDDPSIDATQAAEYARRMGQFGFDTSHRSIDAVKRDVDGSLTRTRTHVVGVSYLASERDSFVMASGVALHEAGAAGKDDPYAWDHDAYYAARDEALAGAGTRREAFARNRAIAAGERQDPDTRDVAPVEAKDAESTGPSAQADETPDEAELTVEEYEAMPPREQAKVDPDRIPDDAFGKYRVSGVAREQSAVADAMAERTTPDRSHPSIGGR